jgi:hypothetical protein
MSRKKVKLVLKNGNNVDVFIIVKSINTLEFGVPGDIVTRAEVDRILIDQALKIKNGFLTVEFIS